MKTGEEFDLRHGVVVSLFYPSVYEALGRGLSGSGT